MAGSLASTEHRLQGIDNGVFLCINFYRAETESPDTVIAAAGGLHLNHRGGGESTTTER